MEHLSIQTLLGATKAFRNFRAVALVTTALKSVFLAYVAAWGEIPFHCSGFAQWDCSLLNREVGWLRKFGEGDRKLSNLLWTVLIFPEAITATWFPCWLRAAEFIVASGNVGSFLEVLQQSVCRFKDFPTLVTRVGGQCGHAFCWKGRILGRQICRNGIVLLLPDQIEAFGVPEPAGGAAAPLQPPAGRGVWAGQREPRSLPRLPAAAAGSPLCVPGEGTLSIMDPEFGSCCSRLSCPGPSKEILGGSGHEQSETCVLTLGSWKDKLLLLPCS